MLHFRFDIKHIFDTFVFYKDQFMYEIIDLRDFKLCVEN